MFNPFQSDSDLSVFCKVANRLEPRSWLYPVCIKHYTFFRKPNTAKNIIFPSWCRIFHCGHFVSMTAMGYQICGYGRQCRQHSLLSSVIYTRSFDRVIFLIKFFNPFSLSEDSKCWVQFHTQSPTQICGCCTVNLAQKYWLTLWMLGNFLIF